MKDIPKIDLTFKYRDKTRSFKRHLEKHKWEPHDEQSNHFIDFGPENEESPFEDRAMSQEDEILLERVKNLHNLSGQDKFYLHQTVKDDADLLSKLNLRRISTKAKSIPVASKRDSMDTRHFSNCLTLIMRSMLELTPCITPFWVCQRGVLRDPSSFDKIPNQGK